MTGTQCHSICADARTSVCLPRLPPSPRPAWGFCPIILRRVPQPQAPRRPLLAGQVSCGPGALAGWQQSWPRPLPRSGPGHRREGEGRAVSLGSRCPWPTWMWPCPASPSGWGATAQGAWWLGRWSEACPPAPSCQASKRKKPETVPQRCPRSPPAINHRSRAPAASERHGVRGERGAPASAVNLLPRDRRPRPLITRCNYSPGSVNVNGCAAEGLSARVLPPWPRTPRSWDLAGPVVHRNQHRPRAGGRLPAAAAPRSRPRGLHAGQTRVRCPVGHPAGQGSPAQS